MQWYQIATLVGFPSLCVAALLAIARRVIKAIKEKENDDKCLKAGVQALLREAMIKDYNHYKEKGRAPIYAKESFEKCYEAYHKLGFNGVMDGIHDDFLKLPSEPKEKDDE